MSDMIAVLEPIVVPGEVIDGERLIKAIAEIEMKNDSAPLKGRREYVFFCYLSGVVELMDDGSVLWKAGDGNSELTYRSLFESTRVLAEFCKPGLIGEATSKIIDDDDPIPADFHLYFAAPEWWDGIDAQVQWMCEVGAPLPFDNMVEAVAA